MSTQSLSWRQRALQLVGRDLWSPLATARRGVAWAQRSLQFAVLVGQGFVQDLLVLRASALTYYSVLALIPLLAIVASLIKALGVSENLIAIIVDRVAAGSPEAGQRILGLVEQVNFAGLGTIGAAVLFATTVLGLSSIEQTLNTIWGVERVRPWERRLPDYLAVLIVAPLLLGVALSLGTTLQSQTIVRRLFEIPGFASVYSLGLRQAPVVLLCAGFGFLYWFLPNTKVRISSALLGGLVGAVLFTIAQRTYVGFNIGVGRYNALFGGFAAIPLLLVWIYVSWVIVLLGAEVAFVHQNLERMRRARRGKTPGPAAREALGLAIAARVARAFRDDEGALDVRSLSDLLDVPEPSVRGILSDLEAAGLVAARGELKDEMYQLGRAADRIPVSAVLEALRGSRNSGVEVTELGAPIEKILAELDRQTSEVAAGCTLAELAEDLPCSPAI